MEPATPHLLTARDLEDESKYVIARNIPVFAVNKRVKNGKEVKVTKANLARALENAQQNERKSCFPVMTLGHRKVDPNVPETAQPAPVGYVRFHSVGELGGEPVIYASLHYDRATAGEAMTYPFRSADYYTNTDEITGVALLRRDPELDLGVLTYAREGCVLRYLSEPTTMDPTAMPKAASDPTAPRGAPATSPESRRTAMPKAASDPTAPAEAEAPDPGFQNQFSRCMKAGYPHMDKMHAAYAASCAPAMPATPTPAPAAGATDGALPAAAAPPKKEEPPVPEQHANPAQGIQYTRMQEQLTQLQRTIESLAFQKEEAICDAIVAGLVGEKCRIKDPKKLATQLARMNAAERQERVDEIRTCYEKDVDPTGLPYVPVRQDLPKSGYADPEACFQYIREQAQAGKDVSYEQAQAALKPKAA